MCKKNNPHTPKTLKSKVNGNQNKVKIKDLDTIYLSILTVIFKQFNKYVIQISENFIKSSSNFIQYC